MFKVWKRTIATLSGRNRLGAEAPVALREPAHLARRIRFARSNPAAGHTDDYVVNELLGHSEFHVPPANRGPAVNR
jgi:hypothetical protein